MISISIVFPIFNGLSYTRNCLFDIYNNIKAISKDESQLSVVIVDDGSTDGSFEWIQKNYPQVYLLKGDGNLWWSGEINKAVHYAIEQLNIDYLLWWNNDIIADKDYFINLLDALKNNEPNIIIGSKIYLDQNRNIIWSMGGIFNPYTGEKRMIGTNQEDSADYKQPVECDWLTGMGTISHRSVYEKVGMLNEKDFPQYHGDNDFTFRAKLKGFKITVNPNLKLYNDTSHSGLKHDDSFKNLINSMVSIRSSYNFKKDFKFYRLYSKSIRAYIPLFKRYFKYVGGFFKWKILYSLGYRRKQ